MGLVITRKPGDKVVIETPEGEKIEILYKSVDRGSIRLQIDCDRKFLIHRGEKRNEGPTKKIS